MPTIKSPVVVTVKDLTFAFRPQVFADLPDARGFLIGLLERESISPPVAAQYVKMAARLTRQGRISHPELLVHPIERTATNAYVRWAVENYAARIAKIGPAFPSHGLGARVRLIRRHSLVQPYPGKMIPVAAMPPLHDPGFLAARFGSPDPSAPPRAHVPISSEEMAPAMTMVPAPDVWTLHVPTKPTAPHADPCPDCTAIVLDNDQLNVIAEVVEKAWGHRDLSAIPAEAYLFGVPPPGDVDITMVKEKAEKFVAFVGHGTTRDELGGLAGGPCSISTASLRGWRRVRRGST